MKRAKYSETDPLWWKKGEPEIIDGVKWYDSTPPKIPQDIAEKQYQQMCLELGIDPIPWPF